MTAIDTALNSLTIVKTFPYRGAPEEWSNTYFFTGALPTSPASWKTLADHVIAQEKTILDINDVITSAIGHKAGESVAVWSFDYAGAGASVPGTFNITGATLGAGDSASWIRWSTDQLTSKGKPIYLRSYYHPAYTDASLSADTLKATWRTAALAYGNAWVTGFTDGDGIDHTRAGPHGVVGLVPLVASFATTRTLERRGKRP
jgi:hypothetical protein